MVCRRAVHRHRARLSPATEERERRARSNLISKRWRRDQTVFIKANELATFDAEVALFVKFKESKDIHVYNSCPQRPWLTFFQNWMETTYPVPILDTPQTMPPVRVRAPTGISKAGMKKNPDEAAGGKIDNGNAISANDEVGTRTNFETEPAHGELFGNAPTPASRHPQEQPHQQIVTHPEPISRPRASQTISIFKHGGETESFEELSPYYPS